MSLAEKYQEFRQKLNANESVPVASLKVAEYFAKSVREAFYAGAAAVMYSSDDPRIMRAEIDHFRSHK